MTPDLTEADLQRLLGRPVSARLDAEDRAMFPGRRVLITGAGGSIGSELARQIATCQPASVALVERSEYQLFRIERELRDLLRDGAILPFLADVTRPAQMRRVFAQAEPDVVYHAAACKHVPMAERAISVTAEANVVGTAVVADLAAETNARFVLISSDKAAAPQGVMGATKRLAELVVLADEASQKPRARTAATSRSVVVRFGNVLGSSGSFVEIMREEIRRGRPVPITDPTATRFFMTAAEAVALVVRADRLAAGPGIFWLDMGNPVLVLDLAERMLAIEPERGFAGAGITVVGLRPGEKRHEQLADPYLLFHRTVDSRIWRGQQRPINRASVDRWLTSLRVAADRADDAATLAVLTEAVEGFRPGEVARQAAAATSRRKDGRAA
jgi:FlaA1/EpsC-like NDP-sugar epimerase